MKHFYGKLRRWRVTGNPEFREDHLGPAGVAEKARSNVGLR